MRRGGRPRSPGPPPMPPYALAYSRTKLSHTMSRVESDLGNVDIATFREYFTIPLPFCILDPGELWPADPSIERRSLPVQAAWDLWYAFLTAPLRSIAALGDAEANHPVMPEPALSVDSVTILLFSARKSKKKPLGVLRLYSKWTPTPRCSA